MPEEDRKRPVAFAAPPQFFKPLRLNREVSVQPLLTPDNYAENALKLIKSAKKSVWFQNQYINFRGTSDDFTEFRLLVGALKDKIDKGLDVRIICRDMMKQESLDVLMALGFPREVFRFQPACHNKTIIVDGKVVMFGSHNWSNEGVKTNRDASLIFDDEEIADYLARGLRLRLEPARDRASDARRGRAWPRTARRRRRASSACRSPPCSRTARKAKEAVRFLARAVLYRSVIHHYLAARPGGRIDCSLIALRGGGRGGFQRQALCGLVSREYDCGAGQDRHIKRKNAPDPFPVDSASFGTEALDQLTHGCLLIREPVCDRISL